MKNAISVLAVLPLALSAPATALAGKDSRIPDVPTAGVAQSNDDVLPIIPTTAIPAGAIVVGGLIIVGGVVIGIAASDSDSTTSTTGTVD